MNISFESQKRITRGKMEMSWNEFRTQNRGLGKSMQQLSKEFKAIKSPSNRIETPSSPKRSARSARSKSKGSSGSYEFSKSFRGSRGSNEEYILGDPTFSKSRKGSNELWDPPSGAHLRDFDPREYRFKEKTLGFLHHQHADLCVALPVRAFESKSDQILWQVAIGRDSNGKELSKELRLTISPTLTKEIVRCLRGTRRFVAVPMRLEHMIFIDGVLSETEGGAHANILFIDKDAHIIERYDPNVDMKKYEGAELNTRLIWHLYSKIVEFPFSFRSGTMLCPIGLQRSQVKQMHAFGMDEEGYCLAWSIFYLDVRMTYPNLDPKELEKLALSKLKNGDMTEFIQRYAEYFER